MKNILVLLMLVGSFSSLLGQFGINNTAPDASALVDMKATDRGLLIPRVTTAQRALIKTPDVPPGPPAEALLVYDVTLQGFYYYKSGTWYSLNEWVKSDASNDVSLTGNATINGSLTTQSISNSGDISTLGVSTNSITSGSINNSGSITNSGAITTGSLSSSGAISGASLNIAGFGNNPLIPSGVIIMWTGSSPPSGWALCNGQNNTPDLRDRFIVGVGTILGLPSYEPSTYAVGDTGGQNFVSLNTAQMPFHSHIMHGSGGISGSGGPFYLSNNNGAYSGGGGNSFGRQTGFSDSGLRTGITGNSDPIDIRPPYYALAYIMKL